MSVQTTSQAFGELEGKPVFKYVITGESGIRVGIINYGAIVTELIVPDRNGDLVDVVLGFSNLEGYVAAPDIYMGAVCGRYAGRINKGAFMIDAKEYQLTINNDGNTLHGGKKGFDKVVWDAEILPEGNGVAFRYLSRDGEEGFPGNLKTKVVYKVINKSLCIDFYASTDHATPVNLTSHSYFNLTGGKEKNIFNHDLQLHASHVLETGTNLIPTGNIMSLRYSWLDYTTMQSLAKGSHQGGYDHYFVIKKTNDSIIKAAVLKSDVTGILMNVYTTQPGLQLYSGNYLHDQLKFTKNSSHYCIYGGLCLEAQSFPDSPNKTRFPNTILTPGNQFHEQTIYEFTICNELHNLNVIV